MLHIESHDFKLIWILIGTSSSYTIFFIRNPVIFTSFLFNHNLCAALNIIIQINSLCPNDGIKHMSTLDEVTAWCCQAPSHYLNQCWHVANDLLTNTFQWNHSQLLTFSFKKMHLKILSAKYQPFCLSLNVVMTHVLNLPEALATLGENEANYSCNFATLSRGIRGQAYCKLHDDALQNLLKGSYFLKNYF